MAGDLVDKYVFSISWYFVVLTPKFILIIKMMVFIVVSADNLLQTHLQQACTFCSLSDHMFHQMNDDRVSLGTMGKLSVHLTFTAFDLDHTRVTTFV